MTFYRLLAEQMHRDLCERSLTNAALGTRGRVSALPPTGRDANPSAPRPTPKWTSGDEWNAAALNDPRPTLTGSKGRGDTKNPHPHAEGRRDGRDAVDAKPMVRTSLKGISATDAQPDAGTRPSTRSHEHARQARHPQERPGEGANIDPSVAERFWSFVPQGLSSTECWPWQGWTTEAGYGRLRDGAGGRKAQRAHRLSYELNVGPIPEGMQIDHLCRNRGCVNPAHLEAVTNRVNVLRGVGPTAVNAKRTHCAHGHEFNDESARPDGRGRDCRVCHRERSRRAYQSRHDDHDGSATG